jgi:hypothetical protein
LLGALQLSYNKARQLSITSDLLDIVGGVEALSGAQAASAGAARAQGEQATAMSELAVAAG